MTTNKTKNKLNIFTLFVAGDKLNSVSARQNLERICQTHFARQHKIIIIDILQNFQSALDNNILASPALIASLAQGGITIIGELSDTQKVLAALGVAEKD